MSTAILVHSKDCNHDLTIECLNAIHTHIPMGYYTTRIGNTYVSSENKSIDYNNVTNIMTGDGFWSDRLKIVLEQIEEENIILFLEDMIVKNVESYRLLDTIIDFHEHNNAKITKLGNHAWFLTKNTGIKFGKYQLLKQCGGLYIMTHQPVSIFNKEFLLSTLKEGQTPWQHECQYSDMMRDKVPEGIYVIGTYYNLVEHIPIGTDLGDIVQYHHALTKGERIEYVGRY